jgi:hypothetical protein
VSEYFSSGRAVDVILALVLLEAVALALGHRLRGRGVALLDLLGQTLAGVMLLLALRCALTGADYRWTGVFLTASLPAHLFDLARRMRRT